MSARPHPLRQTLADFFVRYPYQPHVEQAVAYSGGLDSTVLLHAIATLDGHPPVVAVHIDHGLSEQANDWKQHCEEFCLRLKIPLQIIQVAVQQNNNEGLEAAARNARYRVLAEAGFGRILLAHHREDQAETILFRLLRGSGLTGACGMSPARKHGDTLLLRPLLERPRAELIDYANSNKLHWIDDESNFDTSFSRNFLRHKIWPLLTERFAASVNLPRFATHSAEALALLNDLARIDLQECTEGNSLPDDGRQQHPKLLFMAFLRLDDGRQKNLLRYLIRQVGARHPGSDHMHECLRQLRQPPTHRGTRRWPLGDAEIMVSNELLFIQTTTPPGFHAAKTK